MDGVMGLTITPEELCDIKCKVCDIFVEYEQIMTKLNKVGSQKTMKEGNELFAYTWLLSELTFPDYQDDTYATILSNRDIYKIFDRALKIRADVKQNTL